MIFAADTYAKNDYSFPDREDRKTDKDSELYNLQVAQAVYSEFCRGGTYISYDFYTSVSRNRAYALGKQDPAIYENIFYGKEQQTNTLEDIAATKYARRKAYANLNFSIQSPMPKIMDVIVNKLSDLVNRVSIDAMDHNSGAERETLKWGEYVDGKYKAEFAALKALAALPQEEDRYIPRTVEELNLYEAEGGFKLAYEEVMETLTKYAFDQSRWEENQVERIIYDLASLGFAAVVDQYDKYTGQVTCSYVDAEFAGVQYTKEEGNNNPDFGFFVKMVKLSDLLAKGVDQKKLGGIAKSFSGQFGNPSFDDWNSVNKETRTSQSEGYDRWTVPVFVVYWKDLDFKREKKYKNRQGKERTADVDYKYKPRKGEDILETRVKTLREVHWVISSDVVYDYGKCEFQARDGMSEPILPIHMIQVTGRPLVPRLIPALDQYMLAWMRLQQGISMAAMNGYAINMDAVSNLSLGGKKLDPREVIRIWRQTGTLFFKPTDVAGRLNPGNITRPIEQLPGGAGAVIAEAISVMDIAMKQVEELTGINPVSMGAQPDPGQGKAVTEFALVGTNEVLKGVLKKANIIKSDVARAMCLRLQHVIDADSRAMEAYKDVVGETRLELVRIANGHDVKYGVRTHARPTDQDIRELKEMISLSLKNGRDGKVGITEADFVRFNAMINSGTSLKRVALLLDFANQKAQREAEERAMRAQQLDQQGAQQLAAQKAALEERSKQIETLSEIAKENIKGRNEVLVKAVGLSQIGYQEALGMISGTGTGGAVPQQPVPNQAVRQEQQAVIPAGEEGV